MTTALVKYQVKTIKRRMAENGYTVLEVGGSGQEFDGVWCYSLQTKEFCFLILYVEKALQIEYQMMDGYELRVSDNKSEIGKFIFPHLKIAVQMAETYVTHYCNSFS